MNLDQLLSLLRQYVLFDEFDTNGFRNLVFGRSLGAVHNGFKRIRFATISVAPKQSVVPWDEIEAIRRRLKDIDDDIDLKLAEILEAPTTVDISGAAESHIQSIEQRAEP